MIARNFLLDLREILSDFEISYRTITIFAVVCGETLIFYDTLNKFSRIETNKPSLTSFLI